MIAGSVIACGGSSERRSVSQGATHIVDVVMRDIA
jgi:hypothetical protein